MAQINKRHCPSCGQNLKLKKLKKTSKYRIDVESYICHFCNYSEYKCSEREKKIISGRLDTEIGIIK